MTFVEIVFWVCFGYALGMGIPWRTHDVIQEARLRRRDRQRKKQRQERASLRNSVEKTIPASTWAWPSFAPEEDIMAARYPRATVSSPVPPEGARWMNVDINQPADDGGPERSGEAD